MLKAENKDTMDWCHPDPECEDTGPAPGLHWSHFTSPHRDSCPRDLAPASSLHHRFLQTRKIGRGATHLAREKQITNHRSFTKKISGL